MDLDVFVTPSSFRLSRSALVICTGALITFALHLVFSGLYGYQRDELYYIACAKRLAWGYVDQPPFIALVTEVAVRLFGDGLSALRLLPALAAAALVALAATLTERLGGGLFAQIIVMLAIALSPFDLAVGNLLTMNAFEPLFWLLLTAVVMMQAERPVTWRWSAIGIIVGVGFLNKWSMGIYAVALLIGMLVSTARRTFAVPGLLAAVAIAATIALPNLVWQAQHAWPQLQVLRNADIAKNEHISVWLFLVEQLPLMNPLSAPLWIAGLVVLSRSARFAGVAIAYCIFVIFELAMHGKVYYVAPIYPALIAAGGVGFERLTTMRRRYRTGLSAGIVVAGLLIMPLAMPALPLSALLAYQQKLDVRTLKMEDHPIGRVPQQFADQLGWDELESTVARVIGTLSPDERDSAAILTGDYGQAAALDFLGRRDALPPAISGHNQYWIWGPHGEHPVVVAVGVSRRLLAREYRSIETAATYASPYVLPQNSNLPIYICRDPRIPLRQFWPQLRRYV